MTTDLVERLREDARGGKAYHELSDEAADEIERLREKLKNHTKRANALAEIERLRVEELAEWDAKHKRKKSKK